MPRKKALNPKNKVIQIKVPEDLFANFEAEAIQAGISISELGRKIIEVFLE